MTVAWHKKKKIKQTGTAKTIERLKESLADLDTLTAKETEYPKAKGVKLRTVSKRHYGSRYVSSKQRILFPSTLLHSEEGV